MNHHQYYCLIAGLPDLNFDEPVEWISIPGFRQMLREDLEPEDFRQVELVFLREDHLNLVRFLGKGRVDNEGPGNFTYRDFKNQQRLFTAIIPGEDILPPYMIRTMKRAHKQKSKMTPAVISQALAGEYMDYVMEHGCRFLRRYMLFEYELSNLLTYIEAGRHDMDPRQFVTGNTPHAEHLRQSMTRVPARDPEFEYFDEILSLSEIASISERELRIDAMRWEIIDQMIFFEDFDINRILGYLFKLMIVSRWSKLTREEGDNRIRNTLRETKEEYVTGRES